MSNVSDKWFYIAISVLVVVVGAVGIADKYIDSVANQQLKELQSECVRLGYGEYVDGKFVLKEQK